MKYIRQYKGVYVSRNLNEDLQYTLHTCANKEIYGLHKMVLRREIFHTTSKSNVMFCWKLHINKIFK